ncbi:protein DOWN-REGULATED IN DIF1 11-like [Senna tora]|uniref:Protein DOWN-REGULATED IN DIF1 11-like n=1 Tax=Senna tora TaxID=362788 RepID=A0A834W2K6_9FABA|nr:protein DOWN-REGULATED IN DIF1 11-like [Senna tora]
MAKLNKISVIANLCFAIGAVLFSPGLLAVEDDIDELALAPTPSYSDPDLIDSELLRMWQPPSKDLKFLEKCLTKIYPECGEEIFGGMFGADDDILPTKPCCFQLVNMGKKCHDTMVKTVLAIPELKSEAPRVLRNSNRIWKACDSDGAVSPS